MIRWQGHESIMPLKWDYYSRVALVLIGGSHHNLSLSELELLEREATHIRERLFSVGPAESGISGGVLVATCNRFEVYFETEIFHSTVNHVLATISEISDLTADQTNQSLQVSAGFSVVEHLFSVAAGLDSMIVGEAEIAGQVRTAFTLAQKENTTSPLLEQLFQRALATSKVVTSSTGLGAAGRSIVDVALTVAEARYGAIAGKSAIVLGTGAYARVAVAALQRRGCNAISIYSASGRARQFSEAHGTLAVGLDGLAAALTNADLVVGCSGNATSVLNAELLRVTRGDKFLPMIDVALSSDFASDVRGLKTVDVIDLDVVRENAPKEHGEEIEQANDIVQRAVLKFENEQSARTMDPAIAAMRSHVGILIDLEVKRVRDRVGDEVADDVEFSLHRVTNALLHTPSVRARSLVRDDDQKDYRSAIQVLFGIDIETPEDV
jgi:glutamyl-tRNA reductase